MPILASSDCRLFPLGRHDVDIDRPTTVLENLGASTELYRRRSLVLEVCEVVVVHRLLHLAAELRGRRLVKDGDRKEVVHVVFVCRQQPQEDRDAEVTVWDPRDAACLHLDDVCLRR